MKKLIVTIFLALAVLCGLVVISAAKSNSSSGKSQTVKGWVSDAKCGAKNASAKGAECTKKCLAAGEKMVFVTDKDQKVLTVDNPDALKDHIGHHISVKGNVDASASTIHVDSASML